MVFVNEIIVSEGIDFQQLTLYPSSIKREDDKYGREEKKSKKPL